MLGWSCGELARRAGVRDATANRWVAGTREVPAAIVAWLEELARVMEGLPEAPEGPVERP